MAANLPANGSILTQDEHGRASLPKGAERIYGKRTKQDKIGHYVDSRTGEVETIAYRMPEPKKAAKNGKGGVSEPDTADSPNEVPVKLRPDVTQKGLAMIGDLRTDALHQALKDNAFCDQTLIALLVLALAGRNVSVQSGAAAGAWDRQEIGASITEGGVITADDAAIRTAARAMLTAVLSCRDNMSNSGTVARVAGDTIGASALLPSMATEEFLSCLSRQTLERSATEAGVKIETRVKDTRAAMVKHLADATWCFPGALFTVTAQERASEAFRAPRWVSGVRAEAEADEIEQDGQGAINNEDEGMSPGFDDNERESSFDEDGQRQRYAIAAE